MDAPTEAPQFGRPQWLAICHRALLHYVSRGSSAGALTLLCDGLLADIEVEEPADFALLAPRIVGSDDRAAQAVMAQGVGDVARAVDHLQGTAPVPVVFIGGLGPAYAAAMAGRWRLADALGSALDGALLLAREGP